MRLFALLPPIAKAPRGEAWHNIQIQCASIYYIVYTIYMYSMNLNWDISKQVNWKKRSGSIDSNYFARLVRCADGTWNGNQLGMGIGNRLVCRRRWSVPCIQLETANTCWKCPCHADAVAAPKKTHLGSTVAQCCQLSQNMKIKREAGGGIALSSGSAWLTLITFFCVFAFAEA